jgi:hypothetical protein
MRFLTSTLCTTAAVTALAACSGNMATTPTPSTGYALPAQVSPPAASSTRPAEIYNYFQTTASLPPSYPTPNDFEVNFSGDDISEICGTGNPPCLQQPLYGVYNPFCPPSNGTGNPCYPTVTYSPTANITTVEYSGANLYQNVPNHPGDYHFGLFAGFGTQQKQDRLYGCGYWTFNSAPAIRQPFVNVNWSPKAIKSTKWAYAEVYVSVALKPKGPDAAGFWTEIAYVPKGSAQPTLTFTNNGTQTLYVTSSGIVANQAVPQDPSCRKEPACAEDMAILGNLNFAGSPPPGSSGSPFVALARPPKSVLKPEKASPCTSV